MAEKWDYRKIGRASAAIVAGYEAPAAAAPSAATSPVSPPALLPGLLLGIQPTDEQQAIVEVARSGKSFKVYTGAGSGKTKTLEMVAATLEASMYVAFGRSNAEEAKRRFPPTCKVTTAHALAFRPVGRHFQHRLTGSTYHLKRAFLEHFGRHLSRVADDVLATLNTFLASADSSMTTHHVPKGVHDTAYCLNYAKKLWNLTSDVSETFPVTHDVYLKLWQLQGATLPDIPRLVDEAQDLSQVMLAVLKASSSSVQTILVGDPFQQVYAFRGAVNALQSVELPIFPLTQSWRFGQPVADVANAILATRHAPFRMQGMKQSAVTVGGSADATGVIARTNAGLVGAAWEAVQAGKAIHVFGGVDEVTRSLEAALAVYNGVPTQHETFSLFGSWKELKETVQRSAVAREFAPIVSLVEEYKASIPKVCAGLRDAHTSKPSAADVVLGTTHRFKGQEAQRLYCVGDYQPYAFEDDRGRIVMDEDQANVMYVAVTRAQERLTLSPAFASVLFESLTQAETYWRDRGKPLKESGAALLRRVLVGTTDAK